MKRPAFAVAIRVAASVPIASASAGGDAEAGRKFSGTHCSRCHVVG